MPDELPPDDASPVPDRRHADRTADPTDPDAADPTDREDEPPSIAPDRAVLDRVVDAATAVLLVGDNEDEVHLPATALPDGATDGTWLRLDVDTTPPTVLGIDHELTAQRAQDIDGRLARLRRSRRGGRFG